MANNPTLVAASLDDKQLKDSISNLVAHMKRALHTMTKDTDDAVAQIQKSVQKLGQTNVGSSADGGSSRRTQKLKEEEEQTKKTTAATKELRQAKKELTLDQGQAAIQQAVAPKSASESYSVILKNMRENVALLAMEIKSMPSMSLDRQFAAYMQYERQIEQVRNRIAELRKQLNEMANDPNASRLVKRQALEEIGIQQQKIVQLEREQLQTTQQIDAADKQALANKQAQYEKERQELIALSAGERERVTFEQNINSELNRQLQLIKDIDNAKKGKAAFTSVTEMSAGNEGQIKAKLEALIELKKKVAGTPLLSKSNMNMLDWMIGDMQKKIAALGTTTKEASNQSKHSIDEVNAHVAQGAQRERERREEIQRTGRAAQETANNIIRSMHEQLSAEGSAPITGIQQLRDAIIQMRTSYFDMNASDRESPLGKALMKDIKRAEAASLAIQKYNQALLFGQKREGFSITNDSTLNGLRESLKRLTDQYNKLTVAELNAGKGDKLIQQFQDTTRAAQLLQKTLSRPVNLSAALRGDERTLDDIAYKMQRLRSYKQGIDLTKPNAANEIKQVDEALTRLQKDADKWMSKSQEMIKSNTVLGRSWNYMKNRLAFYFTVGASTAFVKNLIEVRSQYEMNERALGILINSAERGTQIFNELSQMALVSPYTLIELSSAAKQLTAYDVAAKDVVDTTRRLADMAAAVGIPIERLTYALGQIKAYGYLNSRDNRMFANAGIPLVKQLADYYTELEGRLVSTADVYDRIKKKSVGYEEVMSVIAKMTDEGGKFYDFQAKMAETLKVQLANLTLAWNNMLNAMGEETQGVLVGGINALKQMFLHWKDIEHILTEVVVALGAYKAYQIITTRLMGATAASLDAQILAQKRNNAAMLERQSLTRKLTYDEAKLIATQNQLTAADYKNALSGKNLTKQKAMLLVALNMNNVSLKAAIVNMGLLTAQEVANMTVGRALTVVFKSIGISIRNAALAMKSFMVSNWWMIALAGLYELYHAWDEYGEHVKEINRSAAEHAKEAFENIKQYLESDVISQLRNKVVMTPQGVSDTEGQKAWDEMREKIELSSQASNTFIARLMSIDDINKRLVAGFNYLSDIERVAGVMKTMSDDAISVSTTTWGGLLGEGLKDDLKDYQETIPNLISQFGDMSNAIKELRNQQEAASVGIGNSLYDLQEFEKEVKKTTTSIYDFASQQGFNTNEQREFFERMVSETAQAEQMGAKETRIYRMKAEEEYYQYAKGKLQEQLQYQQGAQRAATERRIKELDNEFGTQKDMQQAFFEWVNEKHAHEVRKRFGNMTKEEIAHIDWSQPKWRQWAEKLSKDFSNEYGLSFDVLQKLVMQANTWSIHIPVFFQTIGQPLSDVQRDYEARTGKKFKDNPLIKDAKSQVEILDILKKKQKEVAEEMSTAEKAGGEYWSNNKKRLEDENNALVADIHAYNALTDAEEKANKKGNKGSKKDPMLDALKQEISLVEKLQSDYDKLTKSGASQADALATIRGAYGKTIRLLNAQLGGYGLPQIDIAQLITGKDPHKALDHFKATLDSLVKRGLLTLERSKEIEAVIEKLTLSTKTYDLDKITRGLNNELGKLKDEYELAVELDANPEMGDVFADMMGLNKEQLASLPRDFNGVMTKLQSIIDDKLGAGRFSLEKNLSKSALDAWLEANKQGTTDDDAIAKTLNSFREYANKVRLDETKKQTEEWNKLLEKYAEYEYKRKQITEEYEREIAAARKKNAGDDIINAITNKRDERYAELDFNEFMKTPEWIVATGDLANMSKSAIGMLISELERYKRTAKNLSPKQIKQLNQALKKLYTEQRKNNPFRAISNMLAEARDRMSTFDEDIKKTQEEIDNLTKKKKESIVDGIADEETDNKLKKAIGRLKELKANQKKVGKVDASSWVSSINETIGAVKAAVGVFDDLAKAIGGVNSSDVDKVFSVLESAGSGAATGAQIGGAWGAVVGAAVGAATSLISIFAGAENERISAKVEESERAVKRLELAYIDLQHEVEKAYGMATIGANMATKANKELQLTELKRQLALERSRDSKNRDEDKIIDLQKQIKELEYEIADTVDDIVNDLLGISSVGDAMENLMDGFIEALRSGEDAMAVFDENIDNMIANMVKKMYVTKILQPWFDKQWESIQSEIDARAGEIPAKLAEIQSKISIAKMVDLNDNNSLVEALRALGMSEDEIDRLNHGDWLTGGIARNERLRKAYEELMKKTEADAKRTQDELSSATAVTSDDIRRYAELLRSGKPIVEGSMQEVENLLRELGLMKDDASKSLSALQQGLQGVSEETASAVEAYLNGMSQQAYLRNDLLTQIRDAIMSFDMDIQLGVFSQMLLQLQNNYIVMQSMQSMMESWTVPSGNGIRVELIS